jgi:uncharacterized protein
MALLATKGKAPGVYIQEITIPGPIAAAATSIAAFVGPAEKGPLFKPMELTNINQFENLFGSYIDDPYRVFVTHAVKGFFAEGGTDCYFIRVGTGVQASLDLMDRSTSPGQKTLQVKALKEGVEDNTTTVQVADVSLATTNAQKQAGTPAALTAQVPVAVPSSTSADKLKITVTLPADAAKFSQGDLVHVEQGANVDDVTIAQINGADITFQPALANSYNGGTITNKRTLTLTLAADAAGFTPGDVVHIEQAAKKEDATIFSISGAAITFESPLTNAYSGGTIRIADLAVGQKKIRVENTANLEPGSYVSISDGTTTETNVVKLINNLTKVLTLTSGLTNPFNMGGVPNVTINSKEFILTVVSQNPVRTETFSGLSMDPRHSGYFANVVSSTRVSVALADPPSTSKPINNLPKVGGPTSLAGGQAEDLGTLTPAQYLKGIDALKKISEVRLLCVPDAVGSKFATAATQTIQTAMVSHSERMQDRFAILDSAPIGPMDTTFTGIVAQRQNLNSDGGYAALYFPWISIANPSGDGVILVPPSGHVAGIYANNDNFFGVFKAPANEQVTTALSVEVPLSDDEQGPLNDLGINVIRTFPFQGVKIWGARTIAPPDVTAWRFVNVRRLLLFIEKSIQDGTRFAVFEPNNIKLWGQIKRMVTDFLMDEYKDGALFGVTPDKAFRVRVDETLNPPEIRAQGILVVEVTVVPTTPAEFIIFQVVQDITGSTLMEAR